MKIGSKKFFFQVLTVSRGQMAHIFFHNTSSHLSKSLSEFLSLLVKIYFLGTSSSKIMQMSIRQKKITKRNDEISKIASRMDRNFMCTSKNCLLSTKDRDGKINFLNLNDSGTSIFCPHFFFLDYYLV